MILKKDKVNPDFDEPNSSYILKSKENYDNLSWRDQKEAATLLNGIGNLNASDGTVITIEKDGAEIIKVYSSIDVLWVIGK